MSEACGVEEKLLLAEEETAKGMARFCALAVGFAARARGCRRRLGIWLVSGLGADEKIAAAGSGGPLWLWGISASAQGDGGARADHAKASFGFGVVGMAFDGAGGRCEGLFVEAQVCVAGKQIGGLVESGVFKGADEDLAGVHGDLEKGWNGERLYTC